MIRADGSSEPLRGIAHFSASAGDMLVIETPGGGGYGIQPGTDINREQR
jgi:5-oxoprolinase (ATP-hydrolysing)